MAYYSHHCPGYKRAARTYGGLDLNYSGPGPAYFQAKGVPATSMDPESPMTQEFIDNFPPTNSPHFAQFIMDLPPDQLASFMNMRPYFAEETSPSAPAVPPLQAPSRRKVSALALSPVATTDSTENHMAYYSHHRPGYKQEPSSVPLDSRQTPGGGFYGPMNVIGQALRGRYTHGGGFYSPISLLPDYPLTVENFYSYDPNTFVRLANSHPRMNPMIPGAGVFDGVTNLASMLNAQRTAIEARSARDRARQSERARLDPGLQAYEQRMNSQVATPATVQFGPERDARIAAQTAAREARDRAQR